MAETKPPMVRRVDAAQATLERFRDKSFKWGTRDCSRLVAHHLRLMGYKVKLPPAGSYGSLRGAKRALTAAGHETPTAAIDAFGFERIPPASAVAGDVIEWPSENELSALGIALGNGRMVAFHPEAAGATVLQPNQYITAWRVHPI
jgi:hypothetical protein